MTAQLAGVSWRGTNWLRLSMLLSKLQQQSGESPICWLRLSSKWAV